MDIIEIEEANLNDKLKDVYVIYGLKINPEYLIAFDNKYFFKYNNNYYFGCFLEIFQKDFGTILKCTFNLEWFQNHINMLKKTLNMNNNIFIEDKLTIIIGKIKEF